MCGVVHVVVIGAGTMLILARLGQSVLPQNKQISLCCIAQDRFFRCWCVVSDHNDIQCSICSIRKQSVAFNLYVQLTSKFQSVIELYCRKHSTTRKLIMDTLKTIFETKGHTILTSPPSGVTNPSKILLLLSVLFITICIRKCQLLVVRSLWPKLSVNAIAHCHILTRQLQITCEQPLSCKIAVRFFCVQNCS